MNELIGTEEQRIVKEEKERGKGGRDGRKGRDGMGREEKRKIDQKKRRV